MRRLYFIGKVESKLLRGKLAWLVIACHWPVKTAAAELGIGVKCAEYHVAVLKRQIRIGTNNLLNAI